jgi:hypothetical protein
MMNDKLKDAQNVCYVGEPRRYGKHKLETGMEGKVKQSQSIWMRTFYPTGWNGHSCDVHYSLLQIKN